ncbi:MAG: GyrI-like domain-containing protein, partial [Hyphomicrobium sp.]
MKSGLVYLRTQRMTYMRVTGPYETSIPEAWSRMLEWVDRHGLSSPVGRGYGLARDNPAIVGPDRCRYDACIQVSPLFEDRAARELGLVTLPAGPYTRLRHAGGYEPIRSLIGTLYG